MNNINSIEERLGQGLRLDAETALWLFENAPTDWLKEMANKRKQELHQSTVLYNRNVHFEPTNKCVYSCKFCAFYRKPTSSEADGAWDYGLEDLRALLASKPDVTEVHITGGVHPDRDVTFGEDLARTVKECIPNAHVKAFTAVEISYFARKSKLSIRETLARLQAAGLDSLPGGGAEIFQPEVRKKIAGGKAPAHTWLEVHEEAHQLGLKSNATMLYGHLESFADRVDHLQRLRDLQDRTQGFMSFIPLRYRNMNNALSDLPEVTVEEDLRNFAVARLFLDNIPHLKAYWVMLGMPVALEALHFGVNDLDGTIDDTTKIYSMAGADSNPSVRATDLETLIRSQGLEPMERDSFYQPISRG